MYSLFAIPNTYAIGVHLLLEESGADYTVIDPTLATAGNNADFLNISPHARVPALQLPDGSGLCESGAIALYLAETLAESRFSIAPDSPDRARYLQWLFYLSSTLQPEVMLQFHPEFYHDDIESRQSLCAASMHRLNEIWPILDRAYAGKTWLFDARPTAIDFSLATVLLWPECFASDVSDYPNLKSMLNALLIRPAVQNVLTWHGLSGAERQI